MNVPPFRSELSICFAHPAYRLADEFLSRGQTLAHFEVRTAAELMALIHEADVLVISGLWRNELLDKAQRLRFIQATSAGTDQFPYERLASKGIRLASAQGANERAVAEHAMALMLALSRHLHLARDDQAARFWRGMTSDRSQREQELSDRMLLIVGLGRIGSRLAALARAFGMRVIGVRRSEGPGAAPVDTVVPPERLDGVLREADFVALTCPLTPQTEGLIGAPQLEAMKTSAYLINVSRGRVVDEKALVDALERQAIAGAGLDCFEEEPLPASSPLWSMRNVVMTPHTAGETGRSESNVIDLLLDNLARIRDGRPLRNAIV